MAVWFTGSQLSSTVMKRSHKVKVTKTVVYLSDDNLADDKAEKNRKERESKNDQLKATTPVSLNWIRLILFLKKRFDKFYENDDENENVQVPEENNSSDSKSD